jgi:hypothetical protein
MPMRRVSMRRVREILRLHKDAGLSARGWRSVPVMAPPACPLPGRVLPQVVGTNMWGRTEAERLRMEPADPGACAAGSKRST